MKKYEKSYPQVSRFFMSIFLASLAQYGKPNHRTGKQASRKTQRALKD
jgi:hypothetical protein